MHKGGANDPLEMHLEDKSSEDCILFPRVFT